MSVFRFSQDARDALLDRPLAATCQWYRYDQLAAFRRIAPPQAERRSLGVDVKACSRAASNVAQFRSSPSFGRSFEKRALTISTASA